MSFNEVRIEWAMSDLWRKELHQINDQNLQNDPRPRIIIEIKDKLQR